MWKEAVMAQFKELSHSLPKSTGKYQEHPILGQRRPGRNLNPGSLEHEEKALTTRPKSFLHHSGQPTFSAHLIVCIFIYMRKYIRTM
jgi:hypothetical protein